MSVTVIDKLGRTNVYSDDGGEGHWWTPEMMAGTETVEEHLAAVHGLSTERIASLSFDELHTEHDRLHAEAGHNEIVAFMDMTGFGRFLL